MSASTHALHLRKVVSIAPLPDCNPLVSQDQSEEED